MSSPHPLQHPSADHVVLIGGGSTNALTAVRLAERGFRVTILEKAKIGNGSSSRSAAGIRAQFSVEETVIGMQYSEWWYTQFHEVLRTPPDRSQPVIQQNGYLFLYENPEHAAPAWKPSIRSAAEQAWQVAQANVAMQQKIGLPVEILTPREIHDRWPHIEPDRLVGATWCPTIEANWFVNGTNAWAPRLSRRIGGMPLPIAPLKRYLYFLKPGRPIMSMEEWHRLPMTIYGIGIGRGAHSRPENELLMIAWAHETNPEPYFTDEDQDRIDPPFNHTNGIDNYGYAILEQVMIFAPRLADVGGLTATTSGFYGTTPDANPLIGIDANLDNLVHAAGFSGHGLMHAPITTVLVEAIIARDVENGRVRLPSPFDKHTIDLSTFDPGRTFSPSKKEALVL